MKYFFLTSYCIYLSFYSFSQCETKLVDKRKYDTYKSVNDRNIDIRITLVMNDKLIQLVEKDAAEMKANIKDWATRKKYPDLSKYINRFKDLMKDLEKGTQIKELHPLEQNIYCFYNNGNIIYTKLQNILQNDEGDKFDKNITNVSNEIISWQAKINSIHTEISRLFKLYPVK